MIDLNLSIWSAGGDAVGSGDASEGAVGASGRTCGATRIDVVIRPPLSATSASISAEPALGITPAVLVIADASMSSYDAPYRPVYMLPAGPDDELVSDRAVAPSGAAPPLRSEATPFSAARDWRRKVDPLSESPDDVDMDCRGCPRRSSDGKAGR